MRTSYTLISSQTINNRKNEHKYAQETSKLIDNTFKSHQYNLQVVVEKKSKVLSAKN